MGYDAIIELYVDAEGEVWSGGRICNVVSGQDRLVIWTPQSLFPLRTSYRLEVGIQP